MLSFFGISTKDLAVTQARNYNELISIFQKIKIADSNLFNTLYGIKEALEKYSMTSNIVDFAYSKNENKLECLTTVENQMLKFLSDVGLERFAKHHYNNSKR